MVKSLLHLFYNFSLWWILWWYWRLRFPSPPDLLRISYSYQGLLVSTRPLQKSSILGVLNYPKILSPYFSVLVTVLRTKNQTNWSIYHSFTIYLVQISTTITTTTLWRQKLHELLWVTYVRTSISLSTPEPISANFISLISTLADLSSPTSSLVFIKSPLTLPSF